MSQRSVSAEACPYSRSVPDGLRTFGAQDEIPQRLYAIEHYPYVIYPFGSVASWE